MVSLTTKKNFWMVRGTICNIKLTTLILTLHFSPCTVVYTGPGTGGSYTERNFGFHEPVFLLKSSLQKMLKLS